MAERLEGMDDDAIELIDDGDVGYLKRAIENLDPADEVLGRRFRYPRRGGK
jgi:hypothetical protein